jgi:hypothetical protein
MASDPAELNPRRACRGRRAGGSRTGRRPEDAHGRRVLRPGRRRPIRSLGRRARPLRAAGGINRSARCRERREGQAASPRTSCAARTAGAACGSSLPFTRPRLPRPSSRASDSRCAPHRSGRPVPRRRRRRRTGQTASMPSRPTTSTDDVARRSGEPREADARFGAPQGSSVPAAARIRLPPPANGPTARLISPRMGGVAQGL